MGTPAALARGKRSLAGRRRMRQAGIPGQDDRIERSDGPMPGHFPHGDRQVFPVSGSAISLRTLPGVLLDCAAPWRP